VVILNGFGQKKSVGDTDVGFVKRYRRAAHGERRLGKKRCRLPARTL
jgi:hypothetical protein